VGWTGPDKETNRSGSVYQGSVDERFGGRKPPSSAYFSPGPTLYRDPERGFVGGAFWDGRATGFQLDDPAAEQAMGPFLNPVEQGLTDASTVVERVCSASYGSLFRRIWGSNICDDTDRAFTAIARSIAAFERSDRVSPFSSKFDAVIAGRACFSDRERLGRELFEGKAHCTVCHASAGLSGGDVFTDFTYDNLGVPRNPANPFYMMDDVFVNGQPINPEGERWIDPGLGGFLKTLATSNDWRTAPHVSPSIAELDSAQLRALAESNLGKHKVPTLRNVAKRPAPDYPKAYTHNGYFKTLRGLVHFYNTRDVLARCPDQATEAEALEQNCWPAPEVSANLNRNELGDLKLSPDEEDALVAFLETLSDGHTGTARRRRCPP
jgi:cytochrome c peroxidase